MITLDISHINYYDVAVPKLTLLVKLIWHSVKQLYTRTEEHKLTKIAPGTDLIPCPLPLLPLYSL